MTRLFNLESYAEICSYTQIFGESLSLDVSGVAFAYRKFLNTHRDRLFLPPPSLLSHYSKSLVTGQYTPKLLGEELDDQQQGDLVIVRDIDVLSLRNLDCRYIYASAYRYWNYVSQLKDITKEGKPLVIYDLDSLPCPYYLPISFETHPDSTYSIPILDIRTPGDYENLKIPFDTLNTYDSIYEDLARNIVISNPNFVGIKGSSIVQYLKKINIFKIIQDYLIHGSDSGTISVLLEVTNTDNSILYLEANLPVTIVQDIVLNVIPVCKLKEIAQKNLEYNFVLISQYNCLSNFRSSLESHFFLPDTSHPEFNNIWQAKQSQNFPLYGQHLDLITFELADKTEVNVPDENDRQSICYEGERTFRTFIGKYIASLGEIKSSFTLDTPSVILPIKINGKSITDNGVEQVYIIENTFFDCTPSLSIEIHFSLMLGKPLLLEVFEVLGNKTLGRKLEAHLGDRREIRLGFIPIKNISDDRQNKASNAVLNLSLKSDFVNELNTQLIKLKNALNTYKISASKQISLVTDTTLPDLHKILKKSYLSLFQDDKLRYLPAQSESEILNRIVDILKSSQLDNSLREALPIFLRRYDNASGETKSILSEVYNLCLLIMGKLYRLADIYDFSFLFNYLKESLNHPEHIKVLARISSKNSYQKQYLQLFEKPVPKKNNVFYYQYDSYLWGYARILMWYYDFQDNTIDISLLKRHFKLIVEYALSNLNKNSYNQNALISYNQDALISLIYLLTFRELDASFCQSESPEYKLGKELCEKLSSDPVYSKQVSSEKSLNKIFEEFLDGVAGANDRDNMLKAE